VSRAGGQEVPEPEANKGSDTQVKTQQGSGAAKADVQELKATRKPGETTPAEKVVTAQPESGARGLGAQQETLGALPVQGLVRASPFGSHPGLREVSGNDPIGKGASQAPRWHMGKAKGRVLAPVREPLETQSSWQLLSSDDDDEEEPAWEHRAEDSLLHQFQFPLPTEVSLKESKKRAKQVSHVSKDKKQEGLTLQAEGAAGKGGQLLQAQLLQPFTDKGQGKGSFGHHHCRGSPTSPEAGRAAYSAAPDAAAGEVSAAPQEVGGAETSAAAGEATGEQETPCATAQADAIWCQAGHRPSLKVDCQALARPSDLAGHPGSATASAKLRALSAPQGHSGQHHGPVCGDPLVAGLDEPVNRGLVEPIDRVLVGPVSTDSVGVAVLAEPDKQLNAPLFEAASYNEAIPPEFDEEDDYFDLDFFADEVVDAPLELARLDPFFGKGMKFKDGTFAKVDSFIVGCLSGTKLYRVQPSSGGDSIYLSAKEIEDAQVELIEVTLQAASCIQAAFRRHLVRLRSGYEMQVNHSLGSGQEQPKVRAKKLSKADKKKALRKKEEAIASDIELLNGCQLSCPAGHGLSGGLAALGDVCLVCGSSPEPAHVRMACKAKKCGIVVCVDCYLKRYLVRELDKRFPQASNQVLGCAADSFRQLHGTIGCILANIASLTVDNG